MRTIVQPILPKRADIEYHITCRVCSAVMACKIEDLHVSPDPRDDGVYRMRCPHCEEDTWTTLKGKSKHDF